MGEGNISKERGKEMDDSPPDIIFWVKENCRGLK
jgi:hypothetical protein